MAVSERKDDGQVSDEQKSDAGNLESQQEKQSDVQSESNSIWWMYSVVLRYGRAIPVYRSR